MSATLNSQNAEGFPEQNAPQPGPKEKKAKGHPLQRRKRKQRGKVLTFACPAKGCQRPVQLLCPFCQLGSLTCDEQFLVLSCDNCHNTLHHFPCPHCDFPIKASYIQKKQKHFRQLQANADGSKFVAVIGAFLSLGTAIWAIIQLYA